MRRVLLLGSMVLVAGLTTWVLPTLPAAAADYYLHTETSDVLTTTPPSATTVKFKDSPAINRTTFREIGVWSAPPLTSALRLEAVGDLRVWLGLKNSDDQGTYFDLRAELRKNGTAIAEGETKTIPGVTRNPSLAKEITVTFGAPEDQVFSSGDVLSIRLLTKVADSGGHSNAVGLRLYYDAVTRPSRLGLTFGSPGPAPPTITITSPAPGSVLDQPTALVQGQVTSSIEVGVTVNSVVAAVSGDQFAALVPVDPSVTQLTAMATDVAGATASDTVAVIVQAAAEVPVLLRAVPAGGVAPLTVGFTLSSLMPVAQIGLDLEGDGTVDFEGASLEGQSFLYGAPGLYFPTVTIADINGATYTATAILHVYDPTALDTLLQAKWTAMKDALSRGDVNGAVAVFAQTARDAYRDVFTALAGAGGLSQVATDLGGINLVRVRDSAVEYDLRTIRNGTEYSFHVLFVIDSEGLWRLQGF